MIDFRYHLISLVAVFLALGLGLVIGSGLLAEEVREDIENRLADLREKNEEHLEQIVSLRADLERNDEFARALEPHLVGSRLEGEEVVLFSLDGTDGELLDGLRAAVEEAKGTIATTITISEGFALDADEEEAELAAAAGLGGVGDELRLRVASLLGVRAAAMADSRPVPSRRNVASPNRFDDLLAALEDAGFVRVDRRDDAPVVPQGARFLLAAGAEETPAFDIDSFVVGLASALGSRRGEVVVAEDAESLWGVVAAVREDAAASATVSTVDNADTVPGRIATALALADDAPLPGHYGFAAGADAPLPLPPDG